MTGASIMAEDAATGTGLIGTGWTLRRRLVLGIVALLTIITAIIAVTSVFALRGFLVDRLDAQLTGATTRSQDAVEGRPGGPGGINGERPPASDFVQLPGQAPGTLALVLFGGISVASGVLDETGVAAALSLNQQLELSRVAVDGTPRTVNLGGDLGEYRVVANTVGPNGVLVTGLPLTEVNATVGRLLAIIIGVGIVGLLAAAAIGFAVVRLALRPLERVVATATRVSELPLDRGDVALAERVPAADANPSTEVGQVGAAINRMLGHVSSALSARQASENKVRNFVADASHELRTPLASIRGYSELTRRGGHELPADVTHALGRIESESVRMTRLVEDLLLLARLDSGRDLEQHPVELGSLLADVAGDARAASPDHDWVVELPEENVLVLGDAPRLHQVIANLLANARVHTPPGTRVVAAVRQNGQSVEISVADDGPGIDAALLPTLFERFVRGDSSRSRIAGSTGLGLAIVQAVVEAHGGTVAVRSGPGNTEFTITLPALAEGADVDPTAEHAD